MRNPDLVVAETTIGSSANGGDHLGIQVRRIEVDGVPAFDVRVHVNYRITTGPKWRRGTRSYPKFCGYICTEAEARSVANAAWRAAVAVDGPMARVALAAAHREARRLNLKKRF